jgi:hypothetical protein
MNLMKWILAGFLLALLQKTGAQTSTSDCDGAIVLCNDIYTEETAPPGTGNVYEYTGACNNNLETMSLWYTFTVQQDGNLSFILTPGNAADDYDWGLFDITTGGCAGISVGGSSPEVSCSSWGTLNGENGATGISTANGGTGNSNGPGDLNGPPFNADLPVTTGQTFALVVMNWSNSTDGYSIDFGGSTATIFDNINPEIISVEPNCGNNEFYVTFSENIINETAESLDFLIIGNSSEYEFVSLVADNPSADSDDQFTLSLNQSIVEAGTYTLIVSNASGNVEDACGNLALDELFEIELFAPLSFDTTITTACNGEGGSITLSNVSGGAAPYLFEVNNTEYDNFTAANLSDGDYAISITDDTGCEINFALNIPNNPIALQLPPQDSLSCANVEVEIAGLEVLPEQSVDYFWSFQSNGQFGPIDTDSSTPALGAAGTYQVTATNSNNGCSASLIFEIFEENAERIDLSSMIFPNIITPNNDSKNEDWSPYLPGNENFNVASVFETYDLKIFNRWGNLVFDSASGSGRRWSVGDEAAGTYYYILNYRVTCGGVQEGTISGSIQVIRD